MNNYSINYRTNKLAAQPPLKKINHEYLNPFLHTPPTGLENNIILRSLGPRQPITVTQSQNYKTKMGEDANKKEDYGQFVELGGRKRSKSKKNRRKSKKNRRKSKKNRRKSKKNRRKSKKNRRKSKTNK
jgi:hypothetical protein